MRLTTLLLHILLCFLPFVGICQAKSHTYSELNFSIDLTSNWKSIQELGSHEAHANRLFLNNSDYKGEIMLFVESEIIGAGFVTEKDSAYVSMIDAMLQRFGKQAALRNGKKTVSSVHGQFELATRKDDEGNDGLISIWVGEKNGYLYSITIMTGSMKSASATELYTLSESIWKEFDVLNNERFAYPDEHARAQQVSLQSGLISADLSNEGWLETTDSTAHTDYFYEWGFGRIATFQIGAIPVGTETLDDDTLREALLTVLNLNSQMAQKTKPRPHTLGALDASLVTIETQQAELTMSARLIYTQHNGHAIYSVIRWLKEPSATEFPKLVNKAEQSVQTKPIAETNHAALAHTPELAEFYNQIGLQMLRKRTPATAYPYLAHAATCAPDNPFYIINTLDIALQAKLGTQAKQLAAKRDSTLTNNPEVLARLAHIESIEGAHSTAMALFKQAVEAGLQHSDYIQMYLNMLAEENRTDDAIQIIASLRAKSNNRQLMLMEAGFYLRKGDYTSAEKSIHAVEEQFFRDVESVMLLAEVFITDQRYDQCIEMCENYLNEQPHAQVMISMARALIEKKQFREAKEWVEKAIELSPTDQSIKTFHDYVAGLLGRQGNVVLNDAVSPAFTPPELLREATTLQTDAEIEAGAHFDLHSLAIEVTQQKHIKKTYRYKISIHDKSGLQNWGEIGIPFEPLYEKIYVNKLSIYNSDNQKVFEGEGDMDSLYVLEDTQNGILTNRRNLRIPFKGIEVGSRAELTVSLETRSPQETIPFSEHFFSQPIPIRVSTVSITSNNESLACEALNMPSAPSTKPNEWRIEYPIQFTQENRIPSYADYMPYIVIGSLGSDWVNEGDQYLTDVNEYFEPCVNIQTIANELRLAHPNDTKAQALAAFVYTQDRLRYQGVLFGLRYQIPNTADDILTNSYGDCKDHSVILTQLLRALGIEANPFLMNTQGIYSETIRTVDQFDHMIVHALIDGKEYFLDATAKGHSSLEPTDSLNSLTGLIVAPQASRLARIQSTSNAFNVSVSRRQFLREDLETISTSESIQLSDSAAEEYRKGIYYSSPRDMQQWLEGILSSSTTDTRLLNSQTTEPSEAIRITMRYDTLDFGASDYMQIRNRSTWEQVFLHFNNDGPRIAPFTITQPTTIQVSSRLNSAETLMLEAQKMSKKHSTKWCDWEYEITDTGSIIITTGSITLHPDIYAADEYNDFCKEISTFLAGIQAPVSVHRAED